MSDFRSPFLDEHVEFVNPGGLFGPLKLEALETDFYRASHRNKLLAEGFYLSGEVEKYGTGFVRIRERLAKEAPDLELSFREDSGAFWVTIGAVEVFDDGGEATENVDSEGNNGALSGALNEQVLLLIRQFPGIQRKSMVVKFGIPARTADRYISQLTSQNIIERRGSKKTGGYWEISS